MVCIIWLNIRSYKIIFYVNFNDEKMVLQIKSWQPKINKNRKQGIHGCKSVNFLTRRYISKGELNLNLNGPYPCGQRWLAKTYNIINNISINIYYKAQL